MSETERIADQLHRAIHKDAWHGPSFREALVGLTAEEAQTRLVAKAHSIWELVLHSITWQHVAEAAIEEAYPRVEDEENFPVVEDHSEEAWQETIAKLCDGSERLEQAIVGFDDARLDEHVPGKSFTWYGLFHGVIQHHLYHAGQILLLRRALESR